MTPGINFGMDDDDDRNPVNRQPTPADLGQELLYKTDMSATHFKIAPCTTLISQGASLDEKCKHGYTPLINCARYGHHEMAEILLDKGADHKKHDTGRWTPLHWAALNGHVKIVECLIRHGADIHATSNEGWTPLEIARNKKHDSHAGTLKALEKAEQELQLQRQQKNIDRLAHNGAGEARNTPVIPLFKKKKLPGPQ